MSCKKINTPSPSVASVEVPARKGRFRRLAGTDCLEDAHERKLQNQRRYKAKLKLGISGKLTSFIFRNPEYRRLDSTINWPEVFAAKRSDALSPIPLSKHFNTWAATGDAVVLKALSAMLALNYHAISKGKHNYIKRLLFRDPEKERKTNEATAVRRKELVALRRANPENRAVIKDQQQKDFQKHKQRIYAYRNNRRKTDPQYRISGNLRTYIYQRVGKKNTTGQSRFREIVGCSIAEFCKWLEDHWDPWMNWGNYGEGEGCWSVDHSRPCASYDLTDPEQVKACFHYSNQKPMRHVDNLSKGGKYNPELK